MTPWEQGLSPGIDLGYGSFNLNSDSSTTPSKEVAKEGHLKISFIRQLINSLGLQD